MNGFPQIPVASPQALANGNGTNLPGSDELAALQRKEQSLLDELAALQPTDENYQVRIQSIGAELRDIQSKTQELQLRTPNGMVPNAMAPNGMVPMPGVLPPGMGEASFDGMAPNGVAGTYDPMNDPMLLKQIKEELTFQLKQLQQTLTMLGPQDEALSATLKEQQTDLLKQLADVNAKLGSAAAPVADAAALPAEDAAPAVTLPADAAAPNIPGTINAGDAAERIAKVSQAAVLLREAGLIELANHAVNQAGALSDPNFVEAPINAMPRAEAGADWFAPDQAAQAQDIAELKETSAATKSQVEQILADLKNIDAQLKLLSRQAVAEPAAQ